MIVQTITGKRGRVVRTTREHGHVARVYVQLWLTLPGPEATRGRPHPPARVIVAYAPGDVIEVRALPTDGS